jgi:very-short-patch-repair endonuclease
VTSKNAKPPLPGGERVGVRVPRRTALARNLRRSSTEAERKLWSKLRDRQLDGLKFKRQAPIGKFTVDFACLEHHLAIELDGDQHAVDDARRRDADRTTQLEAMGYVVLRFWNHEVVTNLDGIMTMILDQLHRLGPEPPHPDPLPSGERETRRTRGSAS